MPKKITELVAADSVDLTDVLPMDTGSETRKATFEQVKTSVLTGIGIMLPGMIVPYAGTTAPTGWLLCDGDEYSRTDFAGLFTVLGTTYGVGDGSTTFNIPDLREAVPVGVGETSHTVAAHDEFTLGQFKDDQMQQITGSMNYGTGNSGARFIGGSASGAFTRNTVSDNDYVDRIAFSSSDFTTSFDFDSANSTGARTGSVTRGKRIGLNYIIKT